MTAPATSGRHLSKGEILAENAAPDGFGWNCKWHCVLPAPPIGGLLVAYVMIRVGVVHCLFVIRHKVSKSYICSAESLDLKLPNFTVINTNLLYILTGNDITSYTSSWLQILSEYCIKVHKAGQVSKCCSLILKVYKLCD